MAKNSYQTEWNGINLLEIAKDKATLNKNGLPNSLFYKKFYNKLKEKSFNVNDEWKNLKRNTSTMLESIINDVANELNIEAKKLSIISIGCGLGIVELPFIEKGYNITLHEIQSESLDFIKEKVKQRNLNIRTIEGNITDLMIMEKYDIVYLGFIEYTFTQKKEYQKFLSSLYNLLNTNGYLISIESTPDFTKKNLKNYVGDFLRIIGLKRKHPKDAIYWGVLRTLDEKIFFWKKSGFTLKEYGIIDANFLNILYRSKDLNNKIQTNNSIGFLIGKK
ncbi:class I SAM-dependent methyltransferase [Fluviispira sanaruensis]|nr:class I SAM-dependent methyltransferase [Fluviispira sanaruensis]